MRQRRRQRGGRAQAISPNKAGATRKGGRGAQEPAFILTGLLFFASSSTHKFETHHETSTNQPTKQHGKGKLGPLLYIHALSIAS
mmetsp:Transcript_29161/g.59678  ORF Transcript_29161/g.59678 Transcript_29161/m.59678 type:complete len:85 (-) Transcript_29161:61-315(-)